MSFAIRLEQSRQLHEERATRHILSTASPAAPVHHDHMVRRSHPDLEREKERDYRNKPRVRGQHYPTERPAEVELSSRPRPRSVYDNSSSARDHREQRHMMDLRDVRIYGKIF